MTKVVNDQRVETRIDSKTKQLAEEQLKRRGLTLSQFVRSVVTTVAYEGLPKDYYVPSRELRDSIQEVIDNLNGTKPLQGYDNPDDLQKALDE
ncbi:type II toxin-antitoxin system RelB/DinJ family antitoxin [Secundilactobacillus kimchicus]|uniref:Addiction module antitoxin, RelB DinJ family n=1 Tax=Secundilactobacillus kimchicus JCM 15530 TaxID=1302272 RepID=A0A0R1HTX9_9LACO|nr:type II toxin-antitoxin system RelB/DinJ family antitoxin [Secundilactobacillus kimchicus]KRK46850.1 hypothetical protein FC96_GL000910 [Secundilactobacillus kimchicus JCM 15530]MBT9672453.1 damage-inducible protein J [Secundilactobacillus kimchicus]